MVSGILGIVAGVLAVACGWLAWWAIGMRRELQGSAGRARRTGTDLEGSELATAQERTAQLEANVSALTTERAGLLVERYELRQAHERGNTAYGRLEGDLARAR